MLVVSSNYWNVIHGSKPGKRPLDLEGQQIMRLLGKNMAWMLKMREMAGQQAGEPEKEKKIGEGTLSGLKKEGEHWNGREK